MKNSLIAVVLALSMLFFCACDGTAAVSGETEKIGQDGTSAALDPIGENAVITTLADREDPDAESITTLKTYELIPTGIGTSGYVRFIYVDGGYLYTMISRGFDEDLYCYDRDGTLVWVRPVPNHESDIIRYAVVLPNDTMIVVYIYQGRQYQDGFLCLYDTEGTLLNKIEAPEECKLNTSQFSAKILPDDDGGFRVVLLLTTAMLVLDEEMNIEKTIPMDGAMDYMTHRGGDLFWVGYGVNLFEVNIADGTKTPLDEHPYGLADAQSGDLYFDGAGNAYYGDKVGIYALDEDGGRETVLEWLNGLASQSMVHILDRERMYAYQPKALGNQYEYQLLDCSKTTEFSEPRRVIELAMLTYANPFIKEAIQLFNAENERYYIRLIDYSSYGQTDDIERVFGEHMLADEIPDMILMSSFFDIGMYTSKNQLVDLASSFGDDLLGGVRHAMQDGERMWAIPTNMSVMTFAAAESVADAPLTLEKFYTLTDGLSGKGDQAEVQPDSGLSIEYDENGNLILIDHGAVPNTDVPFEGQVLTSDHAAILRVFRNGLYEFVDFEGKDASFDSDEFRRFIEYLRLVDEEYVHINAGRLQMSGTCGYKADSSYLRDNLAGGRLQLLSVNFSNIGLYPALKRLWGDGAVPFSLCGYPSSEGCGAYISTPTLLSVMADSTVHGGCAEFLEFVLSDRVQTSDKLIENTLPVTLSGLSGAIDRYRYFYYIREGTRPMEPIAISDVPLEEYTTDFSAKYNIEVVITDEDKAAMMDFFENCHMQADPDSVITQIVEEELSFWYGGAKTLEETTKIIQSRVWIYLNE